MRQKSFAAVALLATLGLLRPAAAAEPAAWIAGGGLEESGRTDGAVPFPVMPPRPVFAPAEADAVPDLHADYAEEAAQRADAVALDGTGGTEGEPLLDSDYWLGYPRAIPRLLTAPARFDTGDWIRSGAFVVAAGGAFLADESLRRFFRHNRSHVGDDIAAVGYRLGDYKTILAGSAIAYAAGYAADDRRLRETALLVVQGWALTAGATEGIKYLTGRQRPGYTDNHLLFEGPGGSGKSFPSGHAANAFAVAAVVTEQYDDVWVAPVAYGLAGLVAWSRLNDNAHWASDVVVGAGLGYAVGKLVAHFSPFLERGDVTAAALPVAGGGGLQLGFRF